MFGPFVRIVKGSATIDKPLMKWRGRSIADVLEMRADEALAFLRISGELCGRCKHWLMDEIFTLGSTGDDLIGREAQRVKLASELVTRRGHCVYVLDEPTTGLHMSDVLRLVDVLQRLVDQGHSVWAVEHHLDVLWQCDYYGRSGWRCGRRTYCGKGRPESVAKSDTATGEALQERFRR